MGTHVASSLSLPGPRRRSRLWFGVVAAVLVVGGGTAWLAGRDTGSVDITDVVSSALPTRTVEAGAVTVKLAPGQFDATGAAIKITFDTHSEELDLDVAGAARLEVGGVPWPADGWSGDGPGGHHREGELRFRPAGPATGTATLSLDGLPEPVTASWDVGS